MVAFCFVIIESIAAYVFLNDEYQDLRRTFIKEKVTELTHPADNWKVFILEEVLENFSRDNTIRTALTSSTTEDVQRLAFDLWAGSSLSLLGYSSAIHVFDDGDSLVSRFTVEMPYRVRLAEATERMETASSQEWVVLDLTTNTPKGIVRYYRGIVNIGKYVTSKDGVSLEASIGKVVVDIPFFFESLAWSARTGPQTPEVLRNVQEGGIEPRLEEPEALLLARMRGTRVVESSSDVLPAGFSFPPGVIERALALEWPLMETAGPTYRVLIQEDGQSGRYLLAGFSVPRPLQHLLRWSTVLSLYFFFTVGVIVLIILLKSMPLVGDALPTLTPGRRLGFQQKLLASFLIVALLPAIILGVFAVRIIKERFVQESRKEALYKSFNAYKSLSSLIVGEMTYLLEHSDIGQLVDGELPRYFLQDRSRMIKIINESGELIGDTPSGKAWNVVELLNTVPPEQIFVQWVEGKRYVAVMSHPVSFVLERGVETFYIYYGRLLDGELLGEIADEVSADVNVFNGGQLVASSREGLLSGGFISSMMNSEAFMKVSLMDVDHSLVTETAGGYQYEVAYLPILSADFSENAALGLPLLFRPESYHIEVQKTTSIVFSIFALLSAATIGLGLLLARGIFEPLKGLLEGTKRISRGDLSFKLPAKRRDEIGTVVAAFNEMTDQLHRSQTALEERRRYLEVILVNIGTGVISTDDHDRITSVNSAAERILGIRDDDVLERTGAELVKDNIVPQFFALLARGASKETPFVSSEVDLTMDGQAHTVKYMQTRLTSDGRYLGTVYVFEDLTELINSKKLSAWVEMARQIAHEIKNPLTPIKLSTQFMVRAHQQKADDFDTIFQESSETIIQQVEVLRRIATEFSSFGRMQQLDVAPCDIVSRVEDMVTPYRKNDAGVDISFDCPKPKLDALADTEALRKICTNLIENAMEAMPAGGKLDITCSESQVAGNDMITISFRDTGPGLSDEVKKKLFEPYFSTKTTGTGLGLAICRSLSREMGGDVVVSNLDNGAGVEATLFLKRA
jgi:two-component system nitrogen regulation sensor histidine kinase NtrY